MKLYKLLKELRDYRYRLSEGHEPRDVLRDLLCDLESYFQEEYDRMDRHVTHSSFSDSDDD